MNKKNILMLLTLFLSIFMVVRCTDKVKEPLQSNAIAIFKTKNPTNEKIYYYQLLENGKVLDLDTSNLELTNKIEFYNLNSCFEYYVENNEVLNRVIDGCNEKSSTYPDVVKFNDSDIKDKDKIMKNVAKLTHALSDVIVFEINGRIFVNITLNVNWFIPVDLYEYKNDNLIKLDSLHDDNLIQEIYANKVNLGE
jgi:hypothetical protein